MSDLLALTQEKWESLRERAEKAEAECERLRAALHKCREDYHAKVIALQRTAAERHLDEWRKGRLSWLEAECDRLRRQDDE